MSELTQWVSPIRSGPWKPRRLLVVALCTVLPSVAACQDDVLTLDEVRERGFLRAAYTTEPPYAFTDSLGRVTGESPEALRAAAAIAGIPDIRWILLDFGDLIPALEQGRVDVVAAGIYRTPERQARVLFTRPTVCSGPAFVLPEDRASPRDLDEARESGARMAVIAGTVEEEALRRVEVVDDRILVVPDVRTGIAAVALGDADALAITAPTARRAIDDGWSGGLKVVTYTPPASLAASLRACSALAFRPMDRSLATAVDSALARVLGSDARRATMASLGFSPSEAAAMLAPGSPPP